ncbi:hypothetical protein Tco_0422768 [Tanacetum coccineum]
MPFEGCCCGGGVALKGGSGGDGGGGFGVVKEGSGMEWVLTVARGGQWEGDRIDGRWRSIMELAGKVPPENFSGGGGSRRLPESKQKIVSCGSGEAVVVEWVVTVARGGAWEGGSDRSEDGEHYWSWPEKSRRKSFLAVVVVAGCRR